MHTKMRRLPLLLAVAFPMLVSAQEGPAMTQASSPPYDLFDYDSSAPIDVEVVATDYLDDGVIVQDINFPSPRAGRVTAFLILPPDPDVGAAGGDRPGRAGIVFLHWGRGDRTEFINEAVRYARGGAVSMLLDSPWARPEPWRQASEGQIKTPELVRDMYVQTVVDVRRAADLLLSNYDVAPQRLAYVGHSFGATWGGAVAGIEKRFKTIVLIGGLPSVAELEPMGAPLYDDYVARVRGFLTEEELANYKSVMTPIQPIRFVPNSSPASVYMQFGDYDSWIPKKAAESYFDAAGDPKSVSWYPCGHELVGLDVLRDRAQWLADAIGVCETAPPRGQ
jgi:predicted esterase